MSKCDRCYYIASYHWEGGRVGRWMEGGREGSREGGEKAREAYITMNSTLQTDRYVVC